MCLSGLGKMNLSLDSMDILKIVLLIFEAVLLTDCVRGELLHFLKLFIFGVFLFIYTAVVAHY